MWETTGRAAQRGGTGSGTCGEEGQPRTMIAVRGVHVDLKREGARRGLRVDVAEGNAQPLICGHGHVPRLRAGLMWIRVVEGVEWSAACAQAMDTLALKLEAKPCLVHRLALVKLVQLVLVLQLALLIGCASFAGAGIACSVSHRLGAHGGGGWQDQARWTHRAPAPSGASAAARASAPPSAAPGRACPRPPSDAASPASAPPCAGAPRGRAARAPRRPPQSATAPRGAAPGSLRGGGGARG